MKIKAKNRQKRPEVKKTNYKHNYPFRKKSYGLQKETKTTTNKKQQEKEN